MQNVDAAPTTQTLIAITERRQALEATLARWLEFQGRDLPALNANLTAANLPTVSP